MFGRNTVKGCLLEMIQISHSRNHRCSVSLSKTCKQSRSQNCGMNGAGPLWAPHFTKELLTLDSFWWVIFRCFCLFRFTYFFVYFKYMDALSACISTHQKRMEDPTGLQLQAFVNNHMSTVDWTLVSGTSANALNHWVISTSPDFWKYLFSGSFTIIQWMSHT